MLMLLKKLHVRGVDDSHSDKHVNALDDDDDDDYVKRAKKIDHFNNF